VLALWSRDKAQLAVRRRAVELGGAGLREAAVKIASAIEEVVDQYRERLDQWVTARGGELHQQLIEVLGRERSAREDGSAAGDPTTEATREALRRVSDEISRLLGRASVDEPSR
jgi:hypothetical protein